uniref:Uncharacterized protein n=1 Tax=Arion vulgaris TaxID=1028688 RepID=A0A0B6ZIU4_9EUPU
MALNWEAKNSRKRGCYMENPETKFVEKGKTHRTQFQDGSAGSNNYDILRNNISQTASVIIDKYGSNINSLRNYYVTKLKSSRLPQDNQNDKWNQSMNILKSLHLLSVSR